MILLIFLSSLIPSLFCQENAADLEFSPFVFKHVEIPFKNVSINGKNFKTRRLVFGQDNTADLEYSPYIFRHVHVPFKSNIIAKDWFGSDVALVQHPFLAPAKASKPGNPVALPTIAPLVVKWSDLDNVKVNEINGQHFERRVDSHVWWPNKKRK